MSLSILIAWFSISQVAGEGVRFKYTPETWPNDFAECSGPEQSPINLESSKAIPKATPPFVFTNYDVPFTAKVENNGHTVKVTVSQSSGQPQVSGGTFCSDTYDFVEMHAHWDSEHSIDGMGTNLEVHLVHKNSAYGSVSEALQNVRGVAVFGIMFGIDTNYPANSGIVQFGSLLGDVVTAGSSFEKDGFILESIFENVDRASFYNYMGSLTTPPCTEGVLWNVFDKIAYINASTLDQFNNVLDEDGNTLSGNTRHIQPTGGRQVFFRNSDGTSC